MLMMAVGPSNGSRGSMMQFGPDSTTRTQLLRSSKPSRLVVTLLTTRLVRGRVPEVMGMSIGPYVLAPALREFIEAIEPNVHNFYPVSIRTKKPINGVSEHGTHWLLHPPPLVDCLNFDHTVFVDDVEGKKWPRTREDRNYWGGGLRGVTVVSVRSIALLSKSVIFGDSRLAENFRNTRAPTSFGTSSRSRR